MADRERDRDGGRGRDGDGGRGHRKEERSTKGASGADREQRDDDRRREKGGNGRSRSRSRERGTGGGGDGRRPRDDGSREPTSKRASHAGGDSHRRSKRRHSRSRSPSGSGSSRSSGRSQSPRRRHRHRSHRDRRSRSRERRPRDRRDRERDETRPAAAPPATSALPAAAAAAAAAMATFSAVPSAAPLEKAKKEPKGPSTAARAAELFGYTAENNPFGDANLNDAFVWKKKIVKDVETGKRTAAPTKAEVRAEREELLTEIERARARRTAREAETEEMERLRAEELRLRDSAQYHDWERKEDEFHLKQARQRSFIRIREGRERPVDILAKNTLLAEAAERGEDEDDANRPIANEVELNEPASVFLSLPSAELEQLRRDIGDFIELEGADGPNRPFWNALLIVCDDEIARAKAREVGVAAGRSAAALEAVERDIDAQFEGKGEDELSIMEEAIRGTIAAALGHGGSGGGGRGAVRGGAVDVEYWEGVLRHLRVATAGR